MKAEIDLTNKCGSCRWFRLIDDTKRGECLQNPYGDDVAHGPDNQYWVVFRSKPKCRAYNKPPTTNADRIRAMNDEELAEWISKYMDCRECEEMNGFKPCHNGKCCPDHWLDWLKSPAEGEA